MGEETSPSSGTEAALTAAAALAEGDVTTVQGCTPDSSDAVEVSTSECSSSRCTKKNMRVINPVILPRGDMRLADKLHVWLSTC